MAIERTCSRVAVHTLVVSALGLSGCFDGPGFLKQGTAVQTVDAGGPALAQVQSNEGGVVVAIETDRLKIVVSKTDFTGQVTQNAVEMKINQAGPSGQNKPPKKPK